MEITLPKNFKLMNTKSFGLYVFQTRSYSLFIVNQPTDHIKLNE